MTGNELGDKRGRPRRYDFAPDADCRNEFMAYSISALDELLERVVDQIEDLPGEAFAFCGEGVWFSLGWLPLHLAVSELNQTNKMARGLGKDTLELDPSFHARLRYGDLHADGSVPEELWDAGLMIDAMRRVRREVTVPFCKTISDPDQTLRGEDSLTSPRNVIMHQMWHWSFHSGHIGLLRLEWGSDYEWTMAPAPAT